MALKDWTNARDKNEFYNKKTKKTLEIAKQPIHESGTRPKYVIFINSPGLTKSKLLPHELTKTTALKFAKSYMRKH